MSSLDEGAHSRVSRGAVAAAYDKSVEGCLVLSKSLFRCRLLYVFVLL